MPDEVFHTQKTNRFRDSGEHLRISGPPNSADAAVQDFFYAAMHEIERFLSLFGRHTNHRGRRKLISEEKIIRRRGRVFIAKPSRPRRGVRIKRVLDRASEGFYFGLFAMRYLKVYGSLPRNTPIPPTVGGGRFADAIDVNDARELFIKLRRSLTRYESDLRREGLL